MDGIWLEDTRELERHIREMMAHQVLPPEVVGYDVEFGDHPAFGDPAVWIHFHVPGNTPAEWDTARELSKAVLDTSLKLKNLVPHRLSSVRVGRPPSERSQGTLLADA